MCRTVTLGNVQETETLAIVGFLHCNGEIDWTFISILATARPGMTMEQQFFLFSIFRQGLVDHTRDSSLMLILPCSGRYMTLASLETQDFPKIVSRDIFPQPVHSP